MTKGFSFIILFLNILACGDLQQNRKNSETEESQTIQKPKNIYGLDPSSFEIHEGVIQQNEFVADILLRHGIDYLQIDKLAKASRENLDVRKFRAGNKYSVLLARDSATHNRFVYESDRENYHIYTLGDSIQYEKGSHPASYRTTSLGGKIETSLFNAIVDNGGPVDVAINLADIYAWTIDFYRLQKGDFFKLIYTEKLVKGEFAGVERVEGALFCHMQDSIYAFGFDQGEGWDYFDEEKESLRKAFLKSPLKFGRLSSGYSNRRFHPVQKRYKAHLGTDYAAPQGTPIMVTGDGVVEEAQYKKYNGRYVKIRHNGTYSTQYLHMSKIASGIKPGVRVKQGQTIGYVGSTGLATGPHVCYRFWKNGSQVNHRREEVPPAEPLKPEFYEEFEMHVDSIKPEIDKIQWNKVVLASTLSD